MPTEASKRKVSLQQKICWKQRTSRFLALFQPRIDMDIALSTLRRVRRARILRVFLAAIIRSGTFVGTCLLAVSFVGFLRGGDRSNLYLIAFAIISGWCIVAIFRAPWSIRQTACWLDSMADTKSRFVTLLALRDQEVAGTGRSALLRDCTTFGGKGCEKKKKSMWGAGGGGRGRWRSGRPR